MLLSVTLTLLEGLAVTLELFGLTLLFALPLGLVISFGSMSRCAPLRWVVKTIVWVVRGTPLMLQIMVVFFWAGAPLRSAAAPALYCRGSHLCH